MLACVRACGGQKRLLDPLKLKLYSCKLPDKGAGNYPSPLNERQALLAAEPFLQPLFYLHQNYFDHISIVALGPFNSHLGLRNP